MTIVGTIDDGASLLQPLLERHEPFDAGFGAVDIAGGADRAESCGTVKPDRSIGRVICTAVRALTEML
jgi:hypothetical protein